MDSLGPAPTCRCGAKLKIPERGDYLQCPQCGARIRLNRGDESDARFIRFSCICGRRLKVSAINPPESGKCPDCGRMTPVPQSTPEMPTREFSAADQQRLDAWIAKHQGKIAEKPAESLAKHPTERGLRVCPSCGQPVHVTAAACRTCGAAVPK